MTLHVCMLSFVPTADAVDNSTATASMTDMVYATAPLPMIIPSPSTTNTLANTNAILISQTMLYQTQTPFTEMDDSGSGIESSVFVESAQSIIQTPSAIPTPSLTPQQSNSCNEFYFLYSYTNP